jgi:hypothetical protein
MNGKQDEWMASRMNGWLDSWIDGSMTRDGWIFGLLDTVRNSLIH